MGSTRSYSGKPGENLSSGTVTKVSGPMKNVISLLEQLDASRQEVEMKANEFQKAQQKQANMEAKVQNAIAGLDPKTRDMVKGFLQQLDTPTQEKGMGR